MPPIFVVIITLVFLIAFHELGHFLLAKKYGVRVDEFGIGIPPRAWGKKIGETIYSLNWIPLGGFVRLYGEDARIDNERSFSSKPIYQRALIVFGGIAAFFLIAIAIFSVVAFTGVSGVVADDTLDEWENPRVFVRGVLEGSPAAEAGIVMGDIVKEVDGKEVTKRKEAISYFLDNKGEEVEVTVRREGEEYSFLLTPREEDGIVGINLVRIAEKRFPFYEAPLIGLQITGETTYMVVSGFYTAFSYAVTGRDLPDYMELGGPVAIVGMGAEQLERGFSDYLHFVGIITISLAVINALPIPALDGGRLVFLAIEKIKGGAIPQKIEYGLNAIFFLLLLSLMIFITFKDLGF